MRAALFLSVLLLLLTGCDSAISEAQEAVKRQLIDPESARFRDVVRCSHGNGVHGQVNSRNRMGGYVGFQPFYYANGQAAILSSDGDLDLFGRLSSECHGSPPLGNSMEPLDNGMMLDSGMSTIDANVSAPTRAPEPVGMGDPMHGPYEDEGPGEPVPEPTLDEPVATEAPDEAVTNRGQEMPAGNRQAETPGM
jgi:hypothetical protein